MELNAEAVVPQNAGAVVQPLNPNDSVDSGYQFLPEFEASDSNMAAGLEQDDNSDSDFNENVLEVPQQPTLALHFNASGPVAPRKCAPLDLFRSRYFRVSFPKRRPFKHYVLVGVVGLLIQYTGLSKAVINLFQYCLKGLFPTLDPIGTLTSVFFSGEESAVNANEYDFSHEF